MFTISHHMLSAACVIPQCRDEMIRMANAYVWVQYANENVALLVKASEIIWKNHILCPWC